MSEVDDFLKMLEDQMGKGVSRLKVQASEKLKPGEIKEKYHHGRCDVGSPWAKGTVPNFNTEDGCN